MMQWTSNLPKWLLIELIILLTLLNSWLLFLAFHSFQVLITVLITATLLSFLLDYPTQLLQNRGLRRGYAIGIIILVTIGILIICGVTLLPLLLNQLNGLAEYLPVWLESVGQQFEALDHWLDVHHIPLDMSEIAERVSNLLPDELTVLPSQLLDFVLGTADRIIEVLLTVVLTTYLLLHGETFWQGIIQWLPHLWGDRLRQALRKQFRNYFIGQAAVAFLMGLILTGAFFLLQVPFWLVFGLGIGISVLIPFGDFLSIAVVSTLVSLNSIGLGLEVLAIAILTDQIIDSLIAPRILSHLVGLNPVWVLIALLIGGQIGGILGVLIAVPTAATIKTLLEIVKTEPEFAPEEAKQTV